MFASDFLSLEILLPFFLVLAIVYGSLEVSKVFANKAVKGIIAVVFAFFAILNYEVVSFINAILPYAAGFFVVLFLIWIILKPIKGAGGGKGFDPVLIIVILALVLILLARMSVTEYWPESSWLSNANLIWIVGLIILVFIFWKAYKMS